MIWIKTNEAFSWGAENEFQNNIVHDVTAKFDPLGDTPSGWGWDTNNFYASWGTEGSNCLLDDPLLDANLRLTASSPASVAEGGVTISSNYFDKDRVERTAPFSIGAYER